MPVKAVSQAGRMRGGDLSIPHHMEATALALPLTEMNEFNISPFWSTDDLLIWLSVSLSQEAFIFSLRPWNLEIHRKTSDGILTETNLFCGPTWLVCIFVHIEAATFFAPSLLWSRDTAYHRSLCLCTTLAVYSGSRELPFYAWEKYCIRFNSCCSLWCDNVEWYKNKRNHLFLSLKEICLLSL